MRYSLVNGERSEACPGLSGQCCVCGRPTIAKCGDVRIKHWAHASSEKRKCDPWWENETEWHRNWKNCFPDNWQEFIQQDTNGERHIADVKTDQGWVLEFQHSYLKPEELRTRNAFYKKIVWVIDGAGCDLSLIFDTSLNDELKAEAEKTKKPIIIINDNEITIFGKKDRLLWQLYTFQRSELDDEGDNPEFSNKTSRIIKFANISPLLMKTLKRGHTDGTRRALAKTQFFKSLNELGPVSISSHVRKVYIDECAFLKKWSGIHAPVFFDFGDEVLWCLLPVNQNMWGYVVAFPRGQFIELHKKGVDQAKNFESTLNLLNELVSLLLQAQTRERSALQVSGFQRRQLS